MSETIGKPIVLRGVAVSPGIYVGPAVVHDPRMPSVGPRSIAQASVAAELARFEEAVARELEELGRLRAKIRATIDEAHAAIFDPHMMFLQDPALKERTLERVRDRRESAAFALASVARDFAERFRGIEDEYFAARADDVLDVANRVCRRLLAGGASAPEAPVFDADVALVSHDLSPSETARMDHAHVKGIATEVGGPTSHTAILARALRIPAVVGLGPFARSVRPESTVVIDGYAGTVTLDADADAIRRAGSRLRRMLVRTSDLQKLRALPAETIDGYQVRLSANLELPSEADRLEESGAVGIGLLRTEFLFLGRPSMPGEEEQYEAYADLLRRAGSAPVVFRTLDVGGDKFHHEGEREIESNPFLGLRGVRFCLARPAIFRTQLRALLRASAHGDARIMFPMVSSHAEFLEARDILRDCMRELRAEGRPFDESIRLGVMIEVPSAALVADQLAKDADFFSIGTNDLIQYTLAVDRSNERVAALYDPYHPGILRLVRRVVDAARREGIPVNVCGEMAADPMTAVLLVGMGVDELSMGALAIPGIKFLVRNVRLGEARRLAQEVYPLGSSAEVRARVADAFARFRKGRLAGARAAGRASG